MYVAQNWRVNAQRYTMTGRHCTFCHRVVFPPRAVCPYCGIDQGAVLPARRLEVLQPLYRHLSTTTDLLSGQAGDGQ